MKTYGWLVLLFAVTLSMGCSHNPCADCGCLEANCCGWEFYKPCDLIEGKRGCCDRDLCDQPVVVQVEEVAPEAVPAPEAIELPAPVEAPAAPAAPDVGDPPAGPAADMGFPPPR